MASRLRLGVLGLTGRWPRFRAAAVALRDEVRVRAVWDERRGLAEEEAAALGCAASGGVVSLLERDDIDAVLIPCVGWAGLWPLERACAAGKPVLCTALPYAEEHRLEGLEGLEGARGLHFSLWPALELLTAAATEQVQGSLGEPVQVRLDWVVPGPEENNSSLLHSPYALALLAASGELVGGDGRPEGITALEPAPGQMTVFLEGGEGQVAQVNLLRGRVARASCRLRVEATAGWLSGGLPRRLQWSDDDGLHARRLPAVPPEALTLDRFAQAARDGLPPEVGLDRVRQLVSWRWAAVRSAAADGKRVAEGW